TGPKIPGREGPAALDMADRPTGEAQCDQRMVDLEATECQTAREHANHVAAEPAHIVDVVDGYVERHAAALFDIGKPVTMSRWRAAAHTAHDANAAQRPAIEHGFGARELGEEAHDMSHEQAHTRRLTGGDHRARVGQMARDRLFAYHMLSGAR